MKITLLTLIVTFLMAQCQLGNSGEISPEIAKFEGKWKLVKIGGGFRPANQPDLPLTYEEILEFNTSKNTFTRTKDGITIESSSIKATKLTESANSIRDIVVFEKSNTYSFYSFIENPLTLILYQASPLGAVLADGNNYYYEKIVTK